MGQNTVHAQCLNRPWGPHCVPKSWPRFCRGKLVRQMVSKLFLGAKFCPNCGPVFKPRNWAQSSGNGPRAYFLCSKLGPEKSYNLYDPQEKCGDKFSDQLPAPKKWAKNLVHNVGPRVCSSTVRAQCFAPFSEPKSGLESGTAKMSIFGNDGHENDKKDYGKFQNPILVAPAIRGTYKMLAHHKTFNMPHTSSRSNKANKSGTSITVQHGKTIQRVQHIHHI